MDHEHYHHVDVIEHHTHIKEETHPHPSVYQHQHKEVDYNSFVAQDGNIVWAGAMTLAWKNFVEHEGQKQFVLDDHSKQPLADNFNYSPFSRNDLHEECYYIKTGKGQQTVDAINHERDEKFKDCTFPPLTVQLDSNDYISYGYLYKKIMFPFKFTRRTKINFEFNGEKQNKKVASFFAEDEDQFHQVQVYDYVSNEEFTVKIKDQADRDEIYLFKTDKDLSVKQAIDHINHVSTFKAIDSIGDSDQFEVPVLDLDYSRTIADLVGCQLTNVHGVKIEAILEAVKLKLDESGAVVENEGMMFTNESAVISDRKLQFNKPFWVVMKEKGKHPYLCIRVNNV